MFQTSQSEAPGALENKRCEDSTRAPEEKNKCSSRSGSSQARTCSPGSSNACRASDQLPGIVGLMCVTPEVERVVIAAAEGARQSEKPTATESCSLGKFG